VAAFKKGPDYIDASWLAAAAKSSAKNLDTFLASQAAVLGSLAASAPADIAVIEGNRGLFDGFDAKGTHSTAELAKLLDAPVLLVIDASKSTRTVAALVLGCLAMDPDLRLAGIILNRVGTHRQEAVIREALALATNVPVLGALPRLSIDRLPSRHLGLVMPNERQELEDSLERLADAVCANVEISAIRSLAEQAPALLAPDSVLASETRPTAPVRIGLLRDAAFSFYYSENLAALEAEGARLVPISPLVDGELPEIDALYAGGGYPEEHLAALAANAALRTALRDRIEAGLPVWAECGGLMYLAREIVRDGVGYPMVGVLPVTVEQTARPQAHGYVEGQVDAGNPFFALGARIRGHEFHFSRLLEDPASVVTALSLERGEGIGSGRDGIVIRRVFASYMHLFAPGAPDWAPAFVRVARESQLQVAATCPDEGDNDGIDCGRRRDDRSRRGRIHSGAGQVE
jgi:cobyrinic acid a,c-diamide synthase